MSGQTRYLMYTSYIGTGFRGSQCNSTVNHPTIQGVVEQALADCFKLTGNRPLPTKFTSRTDSGVHALENAFHVDLPPLSDGKFIEPNTIRNLLNKNFGGKTNIRITKVLTVPNTFHARFRCNEKSYLYRIGLFKCNEEYIKPVTELDRTYFRRLRNFDYNRAKEATQLFIGEKDFKGLYPQSSVNENSTICNVKSFYIEKAEPLTPFVESLTQMFDYYHFTCKGTRFLYKMVRKMVSLVLSVANNDISLDLVKQMIEKADPSLWSTKVTVVPGHGLYLLNVTFPEESLVTKQLNEDKQSLQSS